MMSVPPPDAPMLNRIAEPKPGRAMAKISSSIGSSGRGWGSGHTLSITESPTESSMLAYTVFTPKLFPKKRKPKTSRIIFKIKFAVLGDISPILPTTTERPVTPPNVKLFGNLKKCDPAMISRVLTVMREYCFAVSATLALLRLFFMQNSPSGFSAFILACKKLVFYINSKKFLTINQNSARSLDVWPLLQYTIIR